MTTISREENIYESIEALLPLLMPKGNDGQFTAIMTCGMAGAGKTTLAKSIVKQLPHFTRLSVDEIVYEKHGLYGTDFVADYDTYQTFMEEASEIYLTRFTELLKARSDIVVERSFYAREDREKFKKMIEEYGGRWVLVHLPVEKEVLWNRIGDRSAKQRDANSALDISRDLFESYWNGFEHPDGEGEVILKVGSVKALKGSPPSES